MSKHSRLVLLFFLLGIAAPGVLRACWPDTTKADARTNEQEQAAVLLARLCVNEASFAHTNDCAAIGHIRLRSAEGRNRTLLEELLVVHGRRSLQPARATAPSRRDSRPWIGDLHADMTRPLHWPEDSLPWERGKRLWRRTLDVARGVVTGDVGDPCHGRPNTWGDRNTDHARAIRNGWMLVHCGETRNLFWRM